MNRFFIDPTKIKDSVIRIDGDDAYHILRVLRLDKGHTIELCDGNGVDYPAEIIETDKDGLWAKLGKGILSQGEMYHKITLYQGIPKGSKMDFIIQKSVELGVYRLVPIDTERTIINPSKGDRIQKKLERWNKISKEAAKQSRRGIIPKVERVQSLDEALKSACHDLKLIAWEGEKSLSLKRALDYGPLKGLRPEGIDIGIIIGPEGGLSEGEISLADEYGWRSVSLGSRILRTETAGMAIVAAIMLYMEEGV